MRVGANIGVIFHHENGFAVLPARNLLNRSSCYIVDIGAGEVNIHGRSFTEIAMDFHVTARLLDEAVNLRKTKARGVPNVLRCKEGLKHPSKRLAVHAGSGVGHGQHDVMTGLHVA